MRPLAVLLVALAALASPAQAGGWSLRSYEWSPASVAACGDDATACFPVAALAGVAVTVFAQDDALRPAGHHVRLEVAFLDAGGAVLAEPAARCPSTTLVVPHGAATLRAHVVPPTAEDVASGACGMPVRGGVVAFW